MSPLASGGAAIRGQAPGQSAHRPEAVVSLPVRGQRRSHPLVLEILYSLADDRGMRAAALADMSDDPSPCAYAMRVGGITDPGVRGKQNQDDFFLEDLGGGTLVMGVLDGHGRELGQLAAHTAKESLRKTLCSPETLARLKLDPERVMTEVFDEAHEAIAEVRLIFLVPVIIGSSEGASCSPLAPNEDPLRTRRILRPQ